MTDHEAFPDGLEPVPAPVINRLGSALKKAFQAPKDWINRFFGELLVASIAFWEKRAVPPANDLLTSTASFGLIYMARRTHAVLDDPLQSVQAAFAGIILTWFLSCFCIFDIKTRSLAAMRACSRVISLGVLLSALVVCTNHVWPWAYAITDRLELGSAQAERVVVLALPGALLGIIFIFSLSWYDPAFRKEIRRHRGWVRISIWTFFFFFALLLIDGVIYGIGRPGQYTALVDA
jgi:hypothetical protein